MVMKKKQSTSLEVILVGNLIVNLPVVLIIFGFISLFVYLELSFNVGVIIGCIIGWIAWSKLLVFWKKWALKKGISPEKLFMLGKLGLINFSRSKIIRNEEE